MNAIKGRLLSTTTTVFTAAVVFMTLQRLKEAYLPPSAVVQDLKGANQSGSIAQANKGKRSPHSPKPPSCLQTRLLTFYVNLPSNPSLPVSSDPSWLPFPPPSDASKDEKKKSIDEMPTHPVAGEELRTLCLPSGLSAVDVILSPLSSLFA
jgi:hypothetical protein